ncbi:MAG: acetylhydrolase [Bacteroidetes bacterium]|nr:acetylhydrolase [Bacteroidota bacterium]
MKNLLPSLFLLVSFWVSGNAQPKSDTKWWNPALHEFPVIEGQAWTKEVLHPFDRLPIKAKSTVRENVWNLSRHSAGLMIRFRSNAEEISVRYAVKEDDHAMNHMPATGVSGVDLYAIDSDGKWLWCLGEPSFSDTIVYRFKGLKPNDGYHNLGREYRLYLPLYNSVEWLEIGVSPNNYFHPLPVRMEKPIVVYGTSIAHGACASRPGMSWTNILGRKMDRPLINLAFSGNGRLEKEMIDLMVEIDTKIYVLDCLPNLWNEEIYDDGELKKRILESVRKLKEKRPEVPVLLTEHAGYTDGFISPDRMAAYTRVNQIQKEVYSQLKAEGYHALYYLSKEEIGLQLDDMVDGTHPNDLGMMHYAEAYEKALRSILKEPIGTISTAKPCIQSREPGNYDWEGRHRAILKMNRTSPPKTVILANSIIHFWGGLPRAELVREEAFWKNIFTPKGVRNFAYGWDRIENVLWRIYHGELDGFEAERIMLMIGTNNLHLNTNEEILEGLKMLVKAIKVRQSNAEIIIMGLLPRRDQEERIAGLNLQIAQLAGDTNIEYGDVGGVFLESDNTIDESLFSDGLHPNEFGYQKMGMVLKPFLGMVH